MLPGRITGAATRQSTVYGLSTGKQQVTSQKNVVPELGQHPARPYSATACNPSSRLYMRQQIPIYDIHHNGRACPNLDFEFEQIPSHPEFGNLAINQDLLDRNVARFEFSNNKRPFAFGTVFNDVVIRK
jgi:hypothetical protein